MTRTTRLWISWGALLVVAIMALSYASLAEREPSTNQERVYEIASTLRCPRCTGQSVAESDVSISREIRTEIGVLIEEGLSDEEIRTSIASGFDQDIRYNPAATGVTGLVWVIPVVAGFAAVAVLVVAFLRWGSRPEVHASDADRELVSTALGLEPSNGAAAGDGRDPPDDPMDTVGEGDGR